MRRPIATRIRTADGAELGASVFEPERNARATVLVTGGVGVPQYVYHSLAAWLSDRGLRCLCFDYRGFGESAASRELNATASLSTWAQMDAVAAFEHAERAWPEDVVLLAHSFGGQLLGLAETLHRVRSAVLIASQSGSARYWRGFSRLKIAAFWRVILPLAAMVYETTPKWLGAQVPRGVAREWARWGRQSDWYFSAHPGSEDRLRAFPSPVLAYSIDDDSLAPPRAVDALVDRFNPQNLTVRQLEPAALGVERIGHYGVFRRGHLPSVWDEIFDFLTYGAKPGFAIGAVQ